MIPAEVRRAFRNIEGTERLSPMSYFLRVSNMLMLAPVEEWKALVPQLEAGTAGTAEFAWPASQMIAAGQVAIIAFAAEELSKLAEQTDPAVALETLEEIRRRWDSIPGGGKRG